MIKDMIGLRNHQGRNSLSLSDDDHPTTWIRRKRVDVEARNKGGHLTVKPLAQGLDGYFDSGVVLTGGIHVMGDDDARGTFSDRGQFVLDSGFIFNASTIKTRFDGWGQTETAPRIGSTPNNQGIGCPVFEYTIYRTYNGTRYSPMYSFYFVRATLSVSFGSVESVNGATALMAARYGPVNAQQRMSVGYGGITLDTDKQFRPFLVRDYYSNATLGFLPCLKDQYPWYLHIRRLSPTILFTKLDYKRSQYKPQFPIGTDIPNRIDNTKCPGCELRFSYDNGDSWTNASSASFFQEFFDTALSLPPDDPTSNPPNTHDTKENAAFNNAVDYLVLQVAPISGTKALCYGLVPNIVWDESIKNYKIGGKVKLGMIDAAAGTVTETQTLYQNDDIAKAWYYMGCQSLEPINGGALLTHAPLVQPTDHWLDFPQPGFTPDGAAIQWQPTLDVIGMNQGYFIALSPNEVGAVSYIGGEYVLRSSKDRGATWSRRALVTNNGQAPQASNQQPVLTQFASVIQIRSGNFGSNPFQGAPWIADSRIPPPNL